ncbi:hypothetical protein HDV03_003126 [Kappamyces sp. JEL0829]|nr:hypothetical protein HDV03_003111 [Kappamyces sp. JEL0829]KAJ3304140.1 hypothetical protein HDV03_003126 [Kappamyces sp. JEL0829]
MEHSPFKMAHYVLAAVINICCVVYVGLATSVWSLGWNYSYSPNYPLFSLCVMVSFFLYAVLLVLASISFLWKIYSARQVQWSAFVSDVVVRRDGIRIAILFGQSGFIMYSGLYIALKENTYVTVQMLNVFQWYFATSLFVFLQHSYVSARAIMKNGISDGPAQNKNLYQTASVVNQRASAESLSTKASGTG